MKSFHCCTTSGEAASPPVNEALKIVFAGQAGVATAGAVEVDWLVGLVVDMASAMNAESSAIDRIAGPSARLTLNHEDNIFIREFLLH